MGRTNVASNETKLAENAIKKPVILHTNLKLIISILKLDLPYDPAVALLGATPDASKPTYHPRDTCTPMFTAALSRVVKM